MVVHILLTLILCIINILPLDNHIRKKWVLPLSFLAIGLFMGFRYDYGLDYWNYYDIFYGTTREQSLQDEFSFYTFFYLFPKYYQYILVKSLLLAFILFYLVRKYVPEKYYWLFIFFFMMNSSLMFTMITAERTCVGAMVLWLGLEFFYFRKKNLVFLTFSILFASTFHTILLSMLIIPFADILLTRAFKKDRIFAILLILIITMVLGTTITSDLFEVLVNNLGSFEKYEHYSEGRFGNANLIGMLYKGLLLLSVYQILKPVSNHGTKYVYSKFVILSLCYAFLYLIGIETDGRFGIIILPFFLIAMTERLQNMGKKRMAKFLLVFPFLFMTLMGLYTVYERMIMEPWLPGNYLVYQTIFDVGFFE